MADRDQHETPRGSDEPDSRGESLRKWLDVLAKLVGALAIAGVTWIVAGFETTVSGINLLAQREATETNLRASMFESLIDPVLGPRSDSESQDPRRQLLLAELLTLNFHDHIEFKPLLLHVDRLLAQDTGSKDSEDGRRSLRSVARRVIDRQINSLAATAQSMNLSRVEPIDMYFRDDRKEWTIRSSCQAATKDDKAHLGETVCHKTKDEKYELKISVSDVSFAEATASIYLEVYQSGRPEPVDTWGFTLTHYDFPLTDNAQIDPSHRFSIVLYEIDSDLKDLQLRLVWFPKGYVTPQERPVDYLTLRRSLGLN